MPNWDDYTAVTTPADADTFLAHDVSETVVGEKMKRTTWANIKATFYAALGALIAAGTSKTTPVDADGLVLQDSAASNATKTLTWANIKATLKTYFDTLYQPVATQWTIVRKTADETIVSTTTVQSDNALLFQMAASTKYAIRGCIYFDTPAAADFKFRFTGGTPTLVRMRWKTVAAGAIAETEGMETAIAVTVNVTGTGAIGGYVEFAAIIHKEAAVNYFQLQWAQITSDAGNTTVLTGSYLEYMAF